MPSKKTQSSKTNTYIPDRVSLPGETLQEILDERQMSQADLALATGRPPKTIHEILEGKAPITPDTAAQLEQALGVPASFWNNLERNYQEYLVRSGGMVLPEAPRTILIKIPATARARPA